MNTVPPHPPDNVFTDIPWIRLQSGQTTVRDVLLNAHHSDVKVDVAAPGYEYMSQLRFLTYLLALVLRYPRYLDPPSFASTLDHIRADGLDSEAIDFALSLVEPASHLFDPKRPFLQRLPLTVNGKTPKGSEIGPGQFPVKKLLPSMPSDQGEDFWNLLVGRESTVDLADATLLLAIHNLYSMAGNNVYAEAKCAMGAPGIRYLGKGFSPTEIVWNAHTLLETLLISLPQKWAQGNGLPAWADPTAEHSMDGAFPHVLWAASWSSNTAVCHWNNDHTRLDGVRIGGVPDEWGIPGQGKDRRNAWKAWWDARNVNDPFYFYRANSKGEMKAQRLDAGRDATDLAVEWAADARIAELQSITGREFIPDFGEVQPLFVRHIVEGTASSPSLRGSEVFVPRATLWGFDLNPDLQDEVRAAAQFVQQLRFAVVAPFHRASSVKAEFKDTVLDDLADMREKASDAFWRNVTPIYQEFIRLARDEQQFPKELYEAAGRAAVKSYDYIVAPYMIQNPRKFLKVRAAVSGLVGYWVKQKTEPFEQKAEGEQ